MFSDPAVVSDLHLVVDLRSLADHRLTERRAVDARICADLHIIFYPHDSDLRDLFVAAALECGMVGVNEGIISTEVAPFGGVKESGIGREGAHQGLDEYLNVKYVCMGGLIP